MKIIERLIPYLTGVISACILYFRKINFVPFYNFDLIISSLISVTVTLMGFILTIITIFISMGDSKTFKLIKSKGYMKDLNRYLISPVFNGLILLLFCFYLATTVKVSSNPLLSNFNLYVLVFLTVTELIAIIRISIIMYFTFNSIMIETHNKYDTKESKPEDAF